MYTFNFIYVKLQTTTKTCLGGQSQASDSSAPGIVGVQSAGSHGIFLFFGFVYNFNFRFCIHCHVPGVIVGQDHESWEHVPQKNETIVAAENQQPLPLTSPNVFLFEPPGGSRRLMLGLAIDRKGATKRHGGSTGAAAFPPWLLDWKETCFLGIYPFSMFLKFTNISYLVDIEPGLFEKSERMHFCAMKSCSLVLVSQKSTERSSLVSKTGKSWHRFRRNKGRPSVKQRT